MTAKTDRELLELAAKAAGIRLHVWGTKGDENFADLDSPGERWNPLTDDGDALRLAVKLGMELDFSNNSTTVEVAGSYRHMFHAGEAMARTRLIIVRAAAAIGETL